MNRHEKIRTEHTRDKGAATAEELAKTEDAKKATKAEGKKDNK